MSQKQTNKKLKKEKRGKTRKKEGICSVILSNII
jgi:hypothetical protein